MLCIFRDYVNLFWFLTWPDGDAMAHRHFPTAMIGAPQELFGAAFVVCYATKQKRKHGRKKQPNRFFFAGLICPYTLAFASILLYWTARSHSAAFYGLHIQSRGMGMDIELGISGGRRIFGHLGASPM